MKSLILACIASVLSVGRVFAAAPASEPTFRIGDVPPALTPMAWVKGEPVTEFRPGRVYVVNFFATWCGSSRQAMPHLSRLAKEHAADLTVVGVSIREGEHAQPTLAAVSEVVRKRGDEMSYIVAMDDPTEKTLYRTWMSAGGMHGVPTAFIIGRDGKLAYVGYMMDDQAAYTFETAVKQALAGTSDLTAARALQEDVMRQTAARLRETAILQPLEDARDRGDYRATVLEADKIIASHADLVGRAFGEKLTALFAIDERQAWAFAREWSQNASLRSAVVGDFGSPDEKTYWGIIGRVVARAKNLSISTYQLAAAYLQDAVLEEYSDQLLLARLHTLAGDFDRAVMAQENAIAAARKDKDFPREYLARLEKTLAEYKQKAGGT